MAGGNKTSLGFLSDQNPLVLTSAIANIYTLFPVRHGVRIMLIFFLVPDVYAEFSVFSMY